MPKITSDLWTPFAQGEYIYIIKTQLLCVCVFVRIVLKRWRNKNRTYNRDRDIFPKVIIGKQVC